MSEPLARADRALLRMPVDAVRRQMIDRLTTGLTT